MRFTPILAIRNLIAKLHPPLSRTPREAQQLLSVLQKSFNRGLDDFHPPPQLSSNVRKHAAPDQMPDVGNLSANAANAHLRAILSHPSLARTTTSSGSSPARVAEVFDAALLKSSVNFETIRACADMASSGPASTEAALQLGPRLATWFTASDSASQKAFLVDSSLMSSVLPSMYNAGLEGTVWDWLRTLYEASTKQQEPSDLLAEDRFIALMTRESIKRHNLIAAVLEYSEACEYRSTRAPSDAKEGSQSQYPLLITGNLVASAVLIRRHRHGIPVPLYDRLLSHAHRGSTHERTVLWPFLSIYHPTAAQSRPLYQALKDVKYREALLAKVGRLQSDRASKILISILDGADLMLSQGSKEKAQFILDFAQRHFPNMLPQQRSADISDLLQKARTFVSAHKHIPPQQHLVAT